MVSIKIDPPGVVSIIVAYKTNLLTFKPTQELQFAVSNDEYVY
jgi:hypothetical protein